MGREKWVLHNGGRFKCLCLCLCLGKPRGDGQRYGTGGITFVTPEWIFQGRRLVTTTTCPDDGDPPASGDSGHWQCRSISFFRCWTKVKSGRLAHTHTQCLPHSQPIGNQKSSHAYTYIMTINEICTTSRAVLINRNQRNNESMHWRGCICYSMKCVL
jgi:hypothetical protein